MKIIEQNIYTDLFFKRPSKVLNILNELTRFETNQHDEIDIYGDKTVMSYVIPLEQNRETLSQIFDVDRYLALFKDEYATNADGVSSIDLVKVMSDLSNHYGVTIKVDSDEGYVIYCDDDDTSVIYNITYQTELAEHIAQQKEQEVPLDTRFTDVMIDIETLDTEPTAVILSIAARAFNIATGEVCQERLYVQLNYANQIGHGRTSSIETTLWWGAQSEEAQHQALRGEASLYQALDDLRLYFHNHCLTDRCVWSRSPAFDLVILKNAFEYERPLWDHTNERDVRTYVWANPKQSPIRLHVPTHIAYQDVDDQIAEVCQVYKSLSELTARE